MHTGGEEAVGLKKKVLLAWLAWGGFLEAPAKRVASSGVAKAKTWVWEEFGGDCGGAYLVGHKQANNSGRLNRAWLRACSVGEENC